VSDEKLKQSSISLVSPFSPFSPSSFDGAYPDIRSDDESTDIDETVQIPDFRVTFLAPVDIIPSPFLAKEIGGDTIVAESTEISTVGIVVVLREPVNLYERSFVTLHVKDDGFNFKVSAFVKSLDENNKRAYFEFYNPPSDMISLLMERSGVLPIFPPTN